MIEASTSCVVVCCELELTRGGIMSLLFRQRPVKYSGAFLAIGAVVSIFVGVPSAAASAAQPTTTTASLAAPPSPNPTIPSAMVHTPPTPPTATAPLSAWRAWSSAQNSWIRSIPYASAFASEGFTLVKLGFNTVTTMPGLPAGISQTTAWWVVRPSSTSSTAVAPQTTTNTASTVSSCASITGPGTDCISTNGSFPAAITASYKYLGSGTILGHVELGVDGCPGSLAANSSDVYLYYGYSVGAYTSTTGSNTWSSQFWDDSGGTYHLWGTVCATY